MKKIIAIIRGVLPNILSISLTILTISLTISSCSFFEAPETASKGETAAGNEQTAPKVPGQGQEPQITTSGMSVTIFIPDYRGLAEQGRAVAPQTAFVRFSIADGNTFVQHGDLLALDPSTLTPVQGAPANLPGSVWNGAFESLDCKNYAAGSLKIELLDSSNKVITSGVNHGAVNVTENNTATATFFTTPEKYTRILGSLDAGDMVFWKVQLISGYKYQLTLTAEGSSWPDIVVFNDDGTFRKYYSISDSAEGQIEFNPESADNCYFGVWADDGDVTSYSISLSYVFDLPQSQIANLNGWTAAVSGTNTGITPLVPPVLVTKDEKSAVEFSAPKEMINNGRARFSRTFAFNAPMALNFKVKTDIGGSAASTFLKLYVDDAEKESYYGLRASWKTYSMIIPAGNHKIEWVLEKDSNLYYQLPYENKAWLADVFFVPDVTAYLDMSPKGPKDIYVGANWAIPLQYTVKAMRSDGSVRPDTGTITYTATGGSVSSTGVYTPPSTPGTYRVTAAKDGKTVSSDIITVHPADYLKRPYTNPINGKTYNGYQGTPGSMNALYNYITFTYPAESTITADGFVNMEGVSHYPDGYLQIFVYKADNSSLRTWYNVYEGPFNIRVWLRFGPGVYKITVSGSQTFTVTNTCQDMGGEDRDPRFLYPSAWVQSDDFRITNLVSDLLYGVSNEREKIKRIHDYLVANTTYDYDSVSTSGKPRKGQDALSVLGIRYHEKPYYEPQGHYLAVCEGYALAAAALLRAAGIETQYVVSGIMNHAWNQVYTTDSTGLGDRTWKFLDVTWDGGYYDYYLLETLGGKNGDHDKGDTRVDDSRSIGTTPAWITIPGDGWF